MLGFNKFRCPYSRAMKRSWYYHLYKLLKHQPHIHTNLVIVAPVNDLARDGTRPLTHLPSDKMAAIFADNIFKCMFWMKKIKFRLKFYWNLFTRVQYDIPALVEIMSWRRIGENPLPEPIVTQFTDAYMRYCGEMRWLTGIVLTIYVYLFCMYTWVVAY